MDSDRTKIGFKLALSPCAAGKKSPSLSPPSTVASSFHFTRLDTDKQAEVKEELITHFDGERFTDYSSSLENKSRKIIPLAKDGRGLHPLDRSTAGQLFSTTPYSPTSYGLQVRAKKNEPEDSGGCAKGEADESSIHQILKVRHSNLQGDLAERPLSNSIDDYEDMPVCEFGEALLRGMGWSEGQAIGKNPSSGMLEPVVVKPRPGNLGLGADPSHLHLIRQGKKKGHRQQRL